MKATNTPTLLRSSRAAAQRLHDEGDLQAYTLIQELCNRLDSPIHLGAGLADGMVHMTAMRQERGQVTILATASIHEDHLRNRDCLVEMESPAGLVEVNLPVIRRWPEGFGDRLEHVWRDVLSCIVNVKLYDLQRVLAEFGFTMKVYEENR